MRQHRLAFCSFTCPDSWEPVAPRTWAAPGSGLVRFHAHLGEEWLLAGGTAADVVRFLKQLWVAMDPAMKVEHEAPMRMDGPGEGWGAVVTMRDEFTRPVRRLVHLLVLGPVACHLTVDRPLELGERLDGLANELAASLRLEATEVLVDARYTPILPTDEPGGSPPPGEPRPVPTLCLALAVPRGWELRTSTPAAATLNGPGLRIEVSRPLGIKDDLKAWLGTRLYELIDLPNARVRAWQSGRLAPRVDFAGLATSRVVGGGTWGKPVVEEGVALGVRDQQFMEWRLAATAMPLPEAVAWLRRVMAASPFLPPAQWETPVAEAWLPLTLRGGWVPKGDGVYVKTAGGMLLLHVASLQSTAPLEKTRPAMSDIIDTVRAGAALLDVHHEEEAVGSWRGLEGYRYALDASFASLGPRSVRAVVLQSGDQLYSCRLTGEVQGEVHPLFLEILERLRIPGMKER